MVAAFTCSAKVIRKMETDVPRVIIANQFATNLSQWVTMQLRKRAIADEIERFERAHPDVTGFLEGVREGDITEIVNNGFTLS